MCGIVGFLGKGDGQDLERMLSSIAHRGPDDKGLFEQEELSFAHARLSVIDVSPQGHQPMMSTDKSAIIIFNGEIYNYKEIKNSLKKKYSFKGNSDTEVILALYLEKGEACFFQLSGMFSIALYDFKRSKLILARDRLGKKPLYYSYSNQTFVFASELKAMMQHSLVKKELNMQALNQYVFYDYIPTPKTILKNVYKLEPGTYLVYENNSIQKHQYWQIEDNSWNGSFDEAKDRLDQLLEESTAKRLVSDVPLGVFLSGGLDSSAIAYYAAKNSSSKIKTFSIGFEEKTFDESPFASEAAKAINTDHHTFMIKSSDVKEYIHSIGRLTDEPIADASIIPTFMLSKNAKEYVTVALGGDGGDELFAGYPTFQAQKILAYYERLPNAIRNKIIEPFITHMPVQHTNFSLGFKLNKFIEGGMSPLAHVHQNWLGSFQYNDRKELFRDDIWQELSNVNEYEHIDGYIKQFKGSRENSILYSYLRSYLLDEVLVKVDRASMFAGLEMRSPLLDEKIVQFAFSLPYEFKIHGFTTKYIFKKLMENKMSRSLVYRKKKGFGLPIGAWLQEDLNQFMRETLSSSTIKKESIFNPDYIQKLIEEHSNGSRDHRKKLWNLMVLELWRKEYGI